LFLTGCTRRTSNAAEDTGATDTRKKYAYVTRVPGTKSLNHHVTWRQCLNLHANKLAVRFKLLYRKIDVKFSAWNFELSQMAPTHYSGKSNELLLNPFGTS